MRRALASLLLCLAAAAPAAAQEERSVLVIIDSSKSMNEPAGNGQTRLDAAKSATKALLGAVPEDARLGLRVYGSKVEEAGRAAGCRDTELVIPVGPVDAGLVERTVDALEGKGRTPIGRSLLAAPGDLAGEGRKTVILVSDGGDNCAPPDPCRAAEQVSEQGIDMTIQVVGLQVNERVREQLACIADAGGGAYVDADDPEQLRAELAAAFARAFRAYEPTGKPIEGGPGPEAAVAAGPGQFLDSLQPEQARWYAVPVRKGQRLRAAATLVAPPPPAPRLSALVDVRLLDPRGKALVEDAINFRTTGGRTPIATIAASMEAPAPADGTYRFGVSAREAAVGFAEPLPVEVTFGGGGGEPPPGPRAGAGKATTRRVVSSDVPELAGIGAGGLVLGLLGGLVAMRRRRS